MANLFNITTTTSSMTLDAQRTGKATFTVTNTSAGSLRARARIEIPDASIVSWFTIEGQAGRVLAPAETTQYTVDIAAPSTAVPKDYTFTLLVVDEALPDENSTEGPAVKFTVPAPAPVPAKKPFPWWIVAVAVVVLILIIGAVVLIVHQNEVAQANVHATSTAIAVTSTAVAGATATAIAGATGTAVALACHPASIPVSGNFSYSVGLYKISGTAIVNFSLPQANNQVGQTFAGGAATAPGGLIGPFPGCVQWTTANFLCNRGTWVPLSVGVLASLNSCAPPPPGINSVSVTNLSISVAF